MKKLFLCSYFAEVGELFRDFVDGSLYGKSVTFIPTASFYEDYRAYVDEGKMVLEKMGLEIENLELSQSTADEIKKTIERNDYIYLSGGNTFFLLSELKRSGADKIIKQQVTNGKIYIGESAGAAVASETVEYMRGMDDVIKPNPQPPDFMGLGLVDCCIVPHYKSYPFEKKCEKILSQYSDLKLIPITNKQAVKIFGKRMEIRTRD